MKFNELIFFLILLCAATAHFEVFKYTEVQLKGSCPKIKYINNLNLPRILGWWYRAFSTLNNPLCHNNDGQTMYAANYDDITLNVDICCRSAANNDIAFCGGKVGSGTVTATSNPGEFIYEFDNQSFTIYVLDTDYENFAIVYGCNSGRGRRMRRDDLIFILSRDYTLTDALETRVRNVVRQNGIEFSKAKPVTQGPSTPYTPNSRCCGRKPMWGPG